MAMITRYDASVAETMRLNGTYLIEWVPIPTTLSATGPVVEWPADHTPGKTPHQGGTETVCELCGKGIRHIYGIAHPVRRLTLKVGSDCVRHVAGGYNGQEIARTLTAEKVKEAALHDATALSAWLQYINRLAWVNHWNHAHDESNDLINAYRKANDKAGWYLGRQRRDGKLHQFLCRIVRIERRIAAKAEGPKPDMNMPQFVKDLLDKMEGVVS